MIIFLVFIALSLCNRPVIPIMYGLPKISRSLALFPFSCYPYILILSSEFIFKWKMCQIIAYILKYLLLFPSLFSNNFLSTFLFNLEFIFKWKMCQNIAYILKYLLLFPTLFSNNFLSTKLFQSNFIQQCVF